MSLSINVNAYSSKENSQFQKHFKAVQFCIENELSFPKETSLFFKGKLDGDDLEDIEPNSILKYIENGVEVKFNKEYANGGNKIFIRLKEIPNYVDVIVVELS